MRLPLFTGLRPSWRDARRSSAADFDCASQFPHSHAVARAQAGGRHFTTLHMFDAQTGWALVSDQVWRTTDGGLHWHNVTPKNTFPQVTSADFLTASLAWIVLSSPSARKSSIEKTTNGGQTWTVLNYSVV